MNLYRYCHDKIIANDKISTILYNNLSLK